MPSIQTTKKSPKLSGHYATAEEANRAKNADLIASLKKMNLKIVDGQPTLPKQQ